MELVTIEEIEESNVPQVFQKGGLRPIINAIKNKAKQEVNDVTTSKGRKDIASLAYSITRSKTYLDGKGKDYVATLKELPRIVDEERRGMRLELETLAEEIRKPLTEWEEAEAARIELIREKIEFLEMTGDPEGGFDDFSSIEIQGFIKAIEDVSIDDSFAELAVEAAKAKDTTLSQLRAQFIILKNLEDALEKKAKEERAQLKKEQEDREKKIADEAAAKATKLAKEVTQGKADEEAKKIKDAQEKKDKEAKELQDEKDKKAQEKIDKANKEAEQARLEKERILREAAEKEAEDLRKKEAKRKKAEDEKADKKLQARKRGEAIGAIELILGSNKYTVTKAAEDIYDAIKAGNIPHVGVA